MKKIAVIGLGYVGLPLAVAFAKKFSVVGFDLKKDRIADLLNGHDKNLEVDDENLKSILTNNAFNEKGLFLSSKIEDIREANIFIIAVPTLIDKKKRPDFNLLFKASEIVSSVLKKGDLVIYESTVYPGATEEECVPILEKTSGLNFNQDFYCGYSPERINPGDKKNTLITIKKVTSGSTPEMAEIVDKLYNEVLLNGTYKASSIKVAEASKVVENAQRDLNISFVNELALIFDRMQIDTTEVLEAAGSKWNFLKFKPGLVGGHCIGIDPYYLTYKAESLGYDPEVILSGRRVNNNMGHFVAKKIIKLMVNKGQKILDSKVLVLGITFKENCPDTRNTKVVDVISELKEFGCKVDVYDPWASSIEVQNEYGLSLIAHHSSLTTHHYDAIILAVSHLEFLSLDLKQLLKNEHAVIYDIKSVLPKQIVDGRL